ncbi:hypothetical protein Q022_05949, partial [Pseudomonas aeruginosa BWHPSA009]
SAASVTALESAVGDAFNRIAKSFSDGATKINAI